MNQTINPPKAVKPTPTTSCYPVNWDDVEQPEPGSAEYLESLLATISDLDDGGTIAQTGLELNYLGLR